MPSSHFISIHTLVSCFTVHHLNSLLYLVLPYIASVRSGCRCASIAEVLCDLRQSVLTTDDSAVFTVKVRRGRLLEDALRVMEAAPTSLKLQPMCVHFLHESTAADMETKGALGSVREFSTLLCQELTYSALVKG